LTASYPLFHSKTYTLQVGYEEFTTLNFALDAVYPGFPIPTGTGEPAAVTAAAG